MSVGRGEGGEEGGERERVRKREEERERGEKREEERERVKKREGEGRGEGRVRKGKEGEEVMGQSDKYCYMLHCNDTAQRKQLTCIRKAWLQGCSINLQYFMGVAYRHIHRGQSLWV